MIKNYISNNKMLSYCNNMFQIKDLSTNECSDIFRLKMYDLIMFVNIIKQGIDGIPSSIRWTNNKQISCDIINDNLILAYSNVHNNKYTINLDKNTALQLCSDLIK